ncbi:MAG TPA: right-handed parallel beta-helix repeat-containing protein [Humibacillus xanthopallidus]|nr:right-handed parallel beta-helix repeat-containing protein [Humibacillus xanthopallidus]
MSGRGRSHTSWGRRAAASIASAVALAAPAALAAGRADSAPAFLYVGGPTCSDTGTGTATTPYCTIAKAAKVAVAGQTVLVSAGTYVDEVSPWRSGTATAPIVFRPASGARVVISGPRHGFTISNQSWITVSGFEVDDTTGSGIYVYNATGITVSGNTVQRSGTRVQGSTQYGMYLNSMTGGAVQGNLVTDNSASGIYVTNGSTGLTIAGNEVSWNAYGYVRNAVGIDLRSGPNLVRDNRVHDNEDSGIQLYPGGDGNTVVDNISFHNKGFTSVQLTNCNHPPTGAVDGCITGDHGIDNYGVTGSTIVGNTVVDNVAAGINVEGVTAGTPTGIALANNVAVDNAVACPDGAGGTVKCPRTRGNLRVDATSQTGTSLDFDLLWVSATGETQAVWGTTSYKTLATFRAASGTEASGLEADPLFVARDQGDLRLRSGSPAIDSANSAAPGQQTADATGAPRVDDPATPDTGLGPRTFDDRGAYEYQP